MPLARQYNLPAPMITTAKKPMRNMMEPKKPNTCIGFLPNVLKNHNVNKSK